MTPAATLEQLEASELACLCVCIAEIKTTVVCPATEKHVKKYKHQESFLVEETDEDYRSITLPYIEMQHFSLQVCVSLVDARHYLQVDLLSLSYLSVGTQHPGEEGGG